VDTAAGRCKPGPTKHKGASAIVARGMASDKNTQQPQRHEPKGLERFCIAGLNGLAARAIMFEGRSAKHAPGQNPGSSGRTSSSAAQIVPGAAADDRTLGCRYELKYHITESKAAAIARFVRPYLQVDRYCKLQRSGDYPIASLYLDSEDMQLCRESLTGQKNRFKLRIRSYTDEPDYPRFFEIKRRMNTIIIKSRARVMDRDLPILLAGRPLPPQNYSADIETINQFQLYIHSLRARPAVLIRYVRQAFEDTSHNKVRVTFDRGLAYKITNLPEVRLGGPGWQRNVYTEAGVVMEIKFTGFYPAWLSQMVKYFDLQLQSISKYASSITESCALRFCAPQLAED
jgi:VTC domain